MSTSPTEPARGPHAPPAAADRGPARPVSKLAVVAMGIAISPWLVVALFTWSDAQPDVWANTVDTALVLLALAAPFAAIVVGGAVAHHYDEMPRDRRPPGAGLAKAARNVGALTLLSGIAWYCSGPWRHSDEPIYDDPAKQAAPSSSDAGAL